MVLSDNSDLFFSFKERIQLETSRLYKQAGVNPLAGIFLINVLNTAFYSQIQAVDSLHRI